MTLEDACGNLESILWYFKVSIMNTGCMKKKHLTNSFHKILYVKYNIMSDWLC